MPIFVVVHMPEGFTALQARRLAEASGMQVFEAEDGMLAQPGRVYVARGGFHLKLRRQAKFPSGVTSATYLQIHLTQDEPRHFCRPAVDATLESLCKHYGGELVVAILTGMGSDGAEGAEAIAKLGGRIAVQDKESSTIWGMPSATLQRIPSAEVLSLEKMAKRLATWGKALPAPKADQDAQKSREDSATQKLSSGTMQRICEMVQRQVGVQLSEQKEYLMIDRLQPVAKKHGYATVDAMVQALALPSNHTRLVTEIAEALCTHETMFLRDPPVFEDLRQRLKEICEKHRHHHGKKEITLWSAACASGQEAYSLAMCWRDLEEKGLAYGLTARILATDVARSPIEYAKQGGYNQFEIQRGVPALWLQKYFSQNGSQWKLKETVTSLVTFQTHNLLEPITTSLAPFDVILCRNVLIYFDDKTRARVIGNLLAHLREGGYLITGSAEYLHEWSHEIAKVSPRNNIFVRERRQKPRA